MHRNSRMLVFAAGVGVVCAALLTALGQWTRPRYERHAEAARLRAILTAFDPSYDAPSAEQVFADFRREVPDGRERLGELPAYRQVRDDRVTAVAVRFAGTGLWGEIEGYLVLAPNLRTIRGLAVTRQTETPGLGGQIASDAFRGRWVGKRIIGPDGEPGIEITTRRAAAAVNEIDGITGATATSEALEAMVNDTIRTIIREAGDER